MGRLSNKEKLKREKEKLESNTGTENTETISDSESFANVAESIRTDVNTGQNEKEIGEIMSAFSEEKKSFEPENLTATENADEDFIPKRERKKRETKEDKKAREEKTERQFKLPGRLVNRMTNRLVGGIIVSVDGWISKTPVPAEFVYLSEEELNDEDNVAMAEEFIKALKLSENPILLYCGVMIGGIVTNYMMIKSMMAAAAKKGQTVNFGNENEGDKNKTT